MGIAVPPEAALPPAALATTRRVVYLSMAGSLAVAIIKFLAAAFTGSSAMLSEGVHSLVDTVNEALLLYGIARSNRRPDQAHPLGYGRELYFWSFIVSLLVLALGAGVSFYEGILHLHAPHPVRVGLVNYVVLALSLLCELASGWLGFKVFRAGKGKASYLGALHASKDPGLFIVVFGDAAALLGLLLATAGLAAAQWLQRPEPDALASIGIGAVLTIAAVLFARETKDLLIGEAALPEVRESILRMAEHDPAVLQANGVMTVQMGPGQIVAAISIAFRADLTTLAIEACVARLEAAIKGAHPDVTTLFVRPQTAAAWHRRLAALDHQGSR